MNIRRTLATIALTAGILLGGAATAQAATVTACPEGYSCTRTAPKPAPCPEGYTCSQKVSAQTAPTEDDKMPTWAITFFVGLAVLACFGLMGLVAL